MLYYIKKYPFSIALILVVIYLSFFKPPSLDIPKFPELDKVVHFLMYAGLSGVLWLEFFRNHKKDNMNVRHAVIGAVVCPILFSGLIELGQEYLTTYRGGDWLDFMANTLGVMAATLVCWYILRPYILKKKI